MGKQHRNYGSFYKPNKTEENKVEVSYDAKTEEVVTEPVTDTPIDESEPQIIKVEVTGAPRVNLRSKPNKDAMVIAVFDSGTILTLMEELPGWYKVTDEKGVGYMMSQYLKKV